MQDIAIVGMSFRMPQDAVDEDGFWGVLENRKNVMTEWPASRVNLDSFYAGDDDPDHNRVRNVFFFFSLHR